MVLYAPSKATRTIVVYEVALTLSLSKSKVVPEEAVVFSGVLTRDGVGWGGQTVTVLIAPDFSVDVITDADGTYTVSWVMPWATPAGEATPGKTYNVTAVRVNPYAASPTLTLTVVAPTRVSIVAVAGVATGEKFKVSGKLEAQLALGVWTPVGGEYVYLTYDALSFGVGKAMTDAATGDYSLSASIATPGTYTLTAEFMGTAGVAAAVAEGEVEVTGVVIPPEIPTWMKVVGITLALVGGGVGVLKVMKVESTH